MRSRLYENDISYLEHRGLLRIAGIDEAGRGALAGPVVVAAVVLDYRHEIAQLNDSKKISKTLRDKLYMQITSSALCFSIVEIPATVIDRINILNATLQGFREVYLNIQDQVDACLIDGRDIPKPVPGEAVIKGDSLHACIAAASILAKVHRDRLMINLDQEYPEFGFAAHKGYGTTSHYRALSSFGACPQHRTSFRLF
ncbi:MAG: ribonuclease HII [Candidatus Cloacimonetes bacterium]|nr:ribonuclease HII [Candidatus Cloacimonadota bacterium]